MADSDEVLRKAREQMVGREIPGLGASWDELEILEDPEDGAAIVKGSLRRRNPKSGEVAEVPVGLRVPRVVHKAKARRDLVQWAKRLELDRKDDADLLDELEVVCVLAYAIREPEPPHAQLASAEELASQYEETSIEECWSKVEALRALMDPRASEPRDVEEVLSLAARCVAAGNMLPLAATDGPAQPIFMLTMAQLALDSERGRRWQQSRESSTPEP